MCCHWPLGGRSPRPDRVLYRQTRPSIKVGLCIDLVPQHAYHTGGTGGGSEISPCPGRLSPALGHEYNHMVVINAIQIQWEGDGVSGMSQHPVPTLQHLSTVPPCQLLSHALNCKTGGIVTTFHRKLNYGVTDYCVKAFTPYHVCDNPLIHPVCAVWKGKTQTTRSSVTQQSHERLGVRREEGGYDNMRPLVTRDRQYP